MNDPARNGGEPVLRIESFFTGRTRCWGLVQDRWGTVRRQFSGDLTGTWDGVHLVLNEVFRYDDGVVERRTWDVGRRGEHGYRGNATDTVGDAIAEAHGNTVYWRYRVRLKIGSRYWKVDFDDRMYMQPDGVVVNVIAMRKWGFLLGRVFAVIRPVNERLPGYAQTH